MLSSLLFLTALFAAGPETEKFPPMFPFPVSAENLPGVLAGDGKSAEIDESRRVRVENAEFLNAENKPVRFLGTNFSFEANFPEKEYAEKEAARLARLGINCVRLHHMDSYNIWGENRWKDQTTIDPKELDKLDYLIYQLKKHGIYVDINLHVSRKFTEREGFSGYDARPEMDKGLDNFEPRMIALQKKYAKDLLTHKNPYTGMRYTEDPCVAVIEINNENSMVASWFWTHLDTLPAEYEAELQKQWNAWLAKKYASTDEMRRAWNCRVIPLSEELLDGAGEPEKWPWYFQMDAEAQATITAVKADGEHGDYVRIQLAKNGSVPWIPQWIRSKMKYQAGIPYTLTFRARADRDQSFAVNVGMDHEPWENLGLYAHVNLTPEWKTFSFSFIPRLDDENGRLAFSSLTAGGYEIADISLRAGGNVGPAADEKLEDGSVKVVKRNAHSHQTPEARRDFTEFLVDTEDAYWSGMYDYIKNTLKARSPVAGTQLQYGSHYAQAKLDFCDIHGYWNHPHFPGGGWSGYHWLLHNRAMVDYLGREDEMTNLASLRVIGKPLTVSEYNHPYPNLYAAEGLPMLCAMGGFQHWSGVFIYSWSHTKNFPHDMAHSFFDACGNSVQLVHMPACYHLLVRGDVPSRLTRELPQNMRIYELGKSQEIDIFSHGAGDYHRRLSEIGIQKAESLYKFTGIRLTDADYRDPAVEKAETADKSVRILGNRSPLHFRQDEKGNPVTENGYFIADTRDTLLFTGFLPEEPIRTTLGTLRLDENRLNWATVTVTRTNPSETGVKRYLLAATGLMKNTDIKIRPYRHPDQETDIQDTPDVRGLHGQPITVSTQWGVPPVLCEGISGEFTFRAPDSSVKYFPLDGSGKRTREITAENGVIRISPEFKTLWYEVEVTP